MEGDMDSITKVDGMESVRLVFFPSMVRVQMDDTEDLAMISEALRRYAADMERGAAGRVGDSWDQQRADAVRMDLLAEVVRESERVAISLATNGGDPARAAALVEALDEAGAQS
jgi:hypothetical protein